MKRSQQKPTADAPRRTAGSGIPVGLTMTLLGLGTVALYWPATRCDFINYDDPLYVTENPAVRAGLNWQGLA